MDVTRVNRDLLLVEHATVRKSTWTFNALGQPEYIKISGAIRLDPERFNLPDLNLLFPVPSNLYDAVGQCRFQFYRFVYADKKLLIRDEKTGKWRNLRHAHRFNPYQLNQAPSRMGGWQWLCVMNRTCGPNETILDAIASIQTYLNNDA